MTPTEAQMAIDGVGSALIALAVVAGTAIAWAFTDWLRQMNEDE